MKLIDHFIYLGSNISSTESDVNCHLVKPWNAVERLLTTGKSDLSDKIKRDSSKLCQYYCMVAILYSYEMLGEKARRKLHKDAVCCFFYKSWKQHSKKQQMYGHLPPVSQTIQAKQTSHVGYCCKTKGDLRSDFHRGIPTHGHTSMRAV